MYRGKCRSFTLQDAPRLPIRGVHIFLPSRADLPFYRRFVSRFLPALQAGQKGTVEWEFCMPVFGTFLFSMGIKPDKLSAEFYDRPFNAASLRTVKRDPLDLTCALLVVPPERYAVDIR